MTVSVLDLPVEDETIRRLELLGFERLEQLRVLSMEDLTLQFGREGRVIWERCRGIEETPAEPEVKLDLLEASFEVDEVGGPWLDELFGRLRDRGELCVQMSVEGLEVNFSRPTGDARKASKLFFERMAGHVFEEVERLRVVITRSVKGRAEQLSFFSHGKRQVVAAMETKGPTALMQVVWDDPKSRLYERRAHLRSLLCEKTERPLCVPRPLKGEVAEVVNRWEVEEDWWTERPISRSYCLVWFANGTPGRVFCDRKTGKWFRAMS
jgi:nucleotidyltransferase/DNA polymerase involved in DNA repair